MYNFVKKSHQIYFSNSANTMTGKQQSHLVLAPVRLSVCPTVPYLRFSRSRKAVETSSLVETLRWTRVTMGANLGSKDQTSKVKVTGSGNETVKKSFFAHIFIKSGSIYIKPRPK